MPTRPELREELLSMRSEDEGLRERLQQAGLLEGAYHPEMQAVHSRNATRIRNVIAEVGWPTAALVGQDGQDAAWLIVQHAIGDPSLQRLVLGLLDLAVTAGKAPSWQLAYLSDRIAFFEGRPQRYGSQFDYDDQGYLVVYTVEDPERVDQLRRSIGLEPLGERLPPRAQQTPMDSEKLHAYRAKALAWAKEVGWRK